MHQSIISCGGVRLGKPEYWNIIDLFEDPEGFYFLVSSGQYSKLIAHVVTKTTFWTGKPTFWTEKKVYP